jgi:hypothetical protein
MASTWTASLGVELIADGEKAGTWGSITNTNLQLLEEAASGYAVYAFPSDADQTLSIPDGALATARNIAIELTGVLTVTRNLNVPAKKKLYFVYNNTNQPVVVKTISGSGITVRVGERRALVCNGTSITELINALSGTAIRVPYFNASGVWSTSANLTFDGALLVAAAVSTNIITSQSFTGTPSSGNYVGTFYANAQHSMRLADRDNTLYDAGYLDIPQVTGTTTLALVHRGKHLSVSSNVTVPANSSVAFPIGSAVSVFNNSGASITISITSDTMRFAGTALTGTRTLAQYGLATLVKVGTTTWVISGAGLT